MDNIANIILSQLGGGRFVAMTGAKNLMNHGEALSFKLPNGFAAQKINSVKITYDASRDLYDISFDRIYGVKFTNIKNLEGVYAEDLQRIFTEETGLDTRL